MSITKILIAAALLSGSATAFSAEAAGTNGEKDALASEYYRLIESDPQAARQARDAYMAIVNRPGSRPPFFSYILGSQWPTALDESKFPSRRGKFPQLQACQKMIDAGSDILKIAPSVKALESQGVEYDGPASLGDVLRTPFYRKILDLPYSVMLFWAHGQDGQFLYHKRMTPAQRESLYREFFDMTVFLLTQYNNSGKTFLIGNWEGDWLAGGYGIGHKVDLPGDTVEKFLDWLDVRTRAIDDAKAATPHENVGVYSYLEMNSIRCAFEKGVKRLVNEVLPRSRVDFVSLSSYDLQGFHSWPEPKTEDNLKPLAVRGLDYVESMLPPRDVPGKRVFIGEIGYTLEEIAKKQSIGIEEAKKEQARLALMQAKVNIEWGVPLWLWWATFSSHEGTFGLADNQTDQPSLLYLELQKYYTWAKSFQASHKENGGGASLNGAFRAAAIQQLEKQIAALQEVRPPSASNPAAP